MLIQIGIWGIWRPGWHFEVFVTFLGPFLSDVCSVAWCIILLGGHCHWGVLFPWRGGVPGLQECLSGWNMSGAIHMNARNNGFPAEQCIGTIWSMLVTSLDVNLMFMLIGVSAVTRQNKTSHVYVQFRWINSQSVSMEVLFFCHCREMIKILSMSWLDMQD